jgi:hypothetical protein
MRCLGLAGSAAPYFLPHDLSKLCCIAEIPAADILERVKMHLASIHASLGDYDTVSHIAKPGKGPL